MKISHRLQTLLETGAQHGLGLAERNIIATLLDTEGNTNEQATWRQMTAGVKWEEVLNPGAVASFHRALESGDIGDPSRDRMIIVGSPKAIRGADSPGATASSTPPAPTPQPAGKLTVDQLWQSDPAIRAQFGGDANVFRAYAQAVQAGQVQDDVLKSRVWFPDIAAQEDGFPSESSRQAWLKAVRAGRVSINKKSILTP